MPASRGNSLVTERLEYGAASPEQRRVLSDDALRHSLQWAFPQAYYAVFAVTLASYKALGYTEVSHASVIRKFGAEAYANKYPASVKALAAGQPPESTGLGSYRLAHSLAYDDADADSVNAQLAQFLCATRRNDLKEKKADIRIDTKSGKRRTAFKPEHWQLVSAALGVTSLLSLLYRKRIKANYRDIDTFLHDELDAEARSHSPARWSCTGAPCELQSHRWTGSGARHSSGCRSRA